jgi:hypothetical protein
MIFSGDTNVTDLASTVPYYAKNFENTTSSLSTTVDNVSSNIIFLENFVGSKAVSEVAATNDVVFEVVSNNGSVLGTLTFVSGELEGVFNSTSEYVLPYNSTLSVQTSETDPTLAGVSVIMTGWITDLNQNGTDVVYIPISLPIGVFGGGTVGSATSIYNYSANTTVAGTNLTYGAGNLAATGNSTEGVFGGGFNVGVYLSIICIYNYSENTTVVGTNLTYATYGLAATGNATEGVFGEGNNDSIYFSVTNIYNYSENTTVVGINLIQASESLAACSPQANGLSS